MRKEEKEWEEKRTEERKEEGSAEKRSELHEHNRYMRLNANRNVAKK